MGYFLFEPFLHSPQKEPVNTNFPMQKHGWRAALATVLAALWLTACGGGDSGPGPATAALATSLPSGQAGAQQPAAGQTQPAAPAQTAAPAQPVQTAIPAPGPATAPSTAEFRVNTTTLGNQENSSIARLKSGGHVIAWISEPDPTSGATAPPGAQGVCTQRYGVDGTALGQETCMAPDVVLLSKPAVAALDDGDYVLVWPVRQTGGENFDHNLFAQRFNANGAPVRAVQQINSTTLSSYLYPTIAAAGLANGGFVVTWTAARTANTSLDIYARRFDAEGAPCPYGAEKRVNTFADSNNLATRTDPSVAGLSDGGYLVTWVGTGQSGFGSIAIYAQRYGANNSPVGPETSLTPDTSGDLLSVGFPAVSGLAGGGYAVTYYVSRRGTIPVIEVQSFRADGTALAAPGTVNPLVSPLPTCTNRQGGVGPCPRPVASPAVAALDDGGFVVAWNEAIGPAATDSYARRYGADGTPAGAPGRVATGYKPAVSGISLGGFLLSQHRFAGSGDDIFARYFDAQAFRGSAAP
jgi:hypothetical protein